MSNPIPQEIRLSRQRDSLTLVYADGAHTLTAEFLRVYSPSAEVRGHGVGQETLQVGKRDVVIDDLQAAGNYALKITFSDGHDSGLYDWAYLRDLCDRQPEMWQQYLAKLTIAGASRDADVAEIALKKHGACGGGSCGCKH
ncbi:DUF971 domain-containing protein [Wielerella bovis]|uniref:gamma-butyrobetaine hydroxylase-like domain-containing protein n=1 Tax=Wielerella bovis TaxID=2917790 RepID=UPI002018D19A|nr:DUF971 domain-containing protein [Wielerella bovis]ULJ70422.1 DUF971 domain-containing protein [Wielerella bovis]